MSEPGLLKRARSRAAQMLTDLHGQWNRPAPVRPIILLHADDWGRTGMPDPAALARLEKKGLPLTGSPWERYGLETRHDLQALGELLAGRRDLDGNPAVMCALFIMANADLRRIIASGYEEFHAFSLAEGFPPPWHEQSLLSEYKALVESRVFYPGLHGYTHFNPGLLLQLARESGSRGQGMRDLHAEDIPYLASVTSEYNFALLDRSREKESFLDAAQQRSWLQQGLELFRQAFGNYPYSACMPGYRFNDTTCRLAGDAGVRVMHAAAGTPRNNHGCWLLPRNVFFEPVLDAVSLDSAMATIHRLVSRGEPVVICTHSINFVSRHVGKAEYGREMLGLLLDRLLLAYPELRFTDDAQLHKSLLAHDPAWWREPTINERLLRTRS